MARVSAPPAAEPKAGTPRRASRRTRVVRWVSRPAIAAATLGIAVAVSVAEGQPSTVERPSGVSVGAATPYPGTVGTLLVVSRGGVLQFDSRTRKATRVALPRGVTALRVWMQEDQRVLLGRSAADGRTGVYVLGRTPRLVGLAETAGPSADGTAVWLVVRGTATRVRLDGTGRRPAVTLPRASRLVADTAYGLVVSTGTVPDPDLPNRRPTPTLTPGRPSVPTPTPPGLSPSAPAVTTVGPTAVPTTPPYTTASPVPSSGPGGIPLTTMVVSYGGTVRFLAEAEALAAAGDVVLLRDGERKLGVISPKPGFRLPRWLPDLSAVAVTGPATLDAKGATFAVLARQNDYARLVVGPTNARTDAALRTVELAGGPPATAAAPPAFTAAGRVIVARPDGRIVYFVPGDRRVFFLGNDVPSATAVVQV